MRNATAAKKVRIWGMLRVSLKTCILSAQQFDHPNVLLLRKTLCSPVHSPVPLFLRHPLITCHIPGIALDGIYNLINRMWSQSSKNSKTTREGINTQISYNIIWKVLGTKYHGSPEEIINNVPAWIRGGSYFLWIVKCEEELLRRENGGKQSRQRKQHVQSLRTIEEHGMLIERGEIQWTTWGMKGRVKHKPREVGGSQRQSDSRH